MSGQQRIFDTQERLEETLKDSSFPDDSFPEHFDNLLDTILLQLQAEAVALYFSHQDQIVFQSSGGGTPSIFPGNSSSFTKTVAGNDAFHTGAPGDADQSMYEQVTPQRNSLRFAAGLPLRHDGDHQLDGSLCVFDHEKLPFSDTEKTIFRNMADLAASHFSMHLENVDRKEREQVFQSIFDNAYQFMGLLSPDGTIIHGNQSSLTFADVELEEVVGEPLWDTTWWDHSSEQQEKIRKGVEKAARGEFVHFETTHESPEGKLHWVDFSITPITDKEGNVTYLLPEGRDITQRIELEREVQEKENLFRTIVENVSEVFYIATPDGEEQIYLSPGIEEVWGVSLDELKEERWRWLESVHEEDRSRVRQKMKDLPREQLDLEYRVVQPDGTIRWIHDQSYAVHDEDDNISMIVGFCDDITEHKRVQEELEQSLQEKSVLLEEVHHRVKNNLQLISSLLNLQLRQVEEEARESLEVTRNRIHAIAQLHEILYQSDDLSHIEFESYINSIVERLRSIYGSREVQLQVELGRLDNNLQIESAIPCGIIVNELVTNALKHAFPDEEEGAITISLSTEDGPESDSERPMIQLVVKDNGIGLPEEINPQDPDTFGLQLVRTMTKDQLNGTYECSTEDGTKFTLTFPLP